MIVCSPLLLWIALKSWYLWYSEQRIWLLLCRQGVVNCSQKLISLIFGTTNHTRYLYRERLWIALKSWYLWYSEQPFSERRCFATRCELLSKVDIFDIRNNKCACLFIGQVVVNCSQKLISLIFGTTRICCSRRKTGLWIALKSWYLWYSEQHSGRCVLFRGVVNCSQKLISLIFGTTTFDMIPQCLSLWIALKSWYLWYSEQPLATAYNHGLGCELLSKVDIFDIRNNLVLGKNPDRFVVNCSQKLISLIFGTTKFIVISVIVLLWIALKSWYLWYSEQRLSFH